MTRYFEDGKRRNLPISWHAVQAVIHRNIQVWNELWIRTTQKGKNYSHLPFFFSKGSIHSTARRTVTPVSASTPKVFFRAPHVSTTLNLEACEVTLFLPFLVMLLRGNTVLHSAKNSFFGTHLPRFEYQYQNLLAVWPLWASKSSF